jgi:cytidyltransferase-like protein
MLGKRILAAGKFDILHLGHLAYLTQAKQLAGEDGELVVVIALDKTIEKQRGAPPVFPQEQRRQIVESLEAVDRAVLGSLCMTSNQISWLLDMIRMPIQTPLRSGCPKPD